MSPRWNDIDFGYWSRGVVEVSTNQFAHGPIVLEIADGDESASEWMTPDEARELAEMLIKAADAADKAGRIVRLHP